MQRLIYTIAKTYKSSKTIPTNTSIKVSKRVSTSQTTGIIRLLIIPYTVIPDPVSTVIFEIS